MICLHSAGVANNVDHDQVLHSAASDLVLLCLVQLVYPNTHGKYGIHHSGSHGHKLSALCTYGKCPKNSNTKESDKMTYANSIDPDQTAPEGAV